MERRWQFTENTAAKQPALMGPQMLSSVVGFRGPGPKQIPAGKIIKRPNQIVTMNNDLILLKSWWFQQPLHNSLHCQKGILYNGRIRPGLVRVHRASKGCIHMNIFGAKQKNIRISIPFFF